MPRFPTAILATGLMILAALSFFAGLILATVTRGRREMKMLAYLQQPAPSQETGLRPEAASSGSSPPSAGR